MNVTKLANVIEVMVNKLKEMETANKINATERIELGKVVLQSILSRDPVEIN